jgi:fatty-acyl-CoA synthase
MIVGLLESQARKPRDVSSIKTIASGGALVSTELARRARETFNVTVQIVYGQTETAPIITQGWADDSFANATETIGQPVPLIDVSIRDTQNNQVVPLGVVGEICCRGYLNMIRYNDNPKATAKTLDSDGWLHTGDLGTMDSQGYCRIAGRTREMIIRGGENLFPAEIENAMLEHEDLAEVAVVGISDEKWGEVVACFLRSEVESVPQADELKAFCRVRLSPQKTPQHWVYVDQWPLTASGKIQKFKLREMFEAGDIEAI